MRFLTNHDLVWLNTTITGAPQDYDYFAVENATAGQYVYGTTSDVVASAATAYRRLIKALPFSHGNRRTAFIVMVSFLAENGWQLSLEAPLVVDVLASLENQALDARPTLDPLVEPIPPATSMASSGMRQIACWCMNRHEKVLQLLATTD